MPFIPEILMLLLPLGFAYLIASAALLVVCTQSCVRHRSGAPPTARHGAMTGEKPILGIFPGLLGSESLPGDIPVH